MNITFEIKLLEEVNNELEEEILQCIKGNTNLASLIDIKAKLDDAISNLKFECIQDKLEDTISKLNFECKLESKQENQ